MLQGAPTGCAFEARATQAKRVVPLAGLERSERGQCFNSLMERNCHLLTHLLTLLRAAMQLHVWLCQYENRRELQFIDVLPLLGERQTLLADHATRLDPKETYGAALDLFHQADGSRDRGILVCVRTLWRIWRQRFCRVTNTLHEAIDHWAQCSFF